MTIKKGVGFHLPGWVIVASITTIGGMITEIVKAVTR